MKEIRTLNANEFIIKGRKESNIYLSKSINEMTFKRLKYIK